MFKGFKGASIMKQSDILGKERHRRRDATGQDWKMEKIGLMFQLQIVIETFKGHFVAIATF